MAENALSLSTVDYEISFLDPDDLTVVGISDFLTETRSSPIVTSLRPALVALVGGIL